MSSLIGFLLFLIAPIVLIIILTMSIIEDLIGPENTDFLYRAYCSKCGQTTKTSRRGTDFLKYPFINKRCGNCHSYNYAPWYESGGWLVEYGRWVATEKINLTKPSQWKSRWKWEKYQDEQTEKTSQRQQLNRKNRENASLRSNISPLFCLDGNSYRDGFLYLQRHWTSEG